MNDQDQQYIPPQPRMPQEPQSSLYEEQIRQMQASQQPRVPQSAPPSYSYGQQPFDQQMYQPMPGAGCLSEVDITLRLVAFILNVICTVCASILVLPLAWMIPMTVRSWKIYKGTKPNTTAFGVCTLLFVSFVGGILLLVSKKDR